MRRSLSVLLLSAAALVLPLGGFAPLLGAQAPAAGALEQKVDQVFAKFGAATPGCAVGVSQAGRPVLEKGYGMADLEHDVPNAGETIFEAGSVSKQFTAAAVLLLAHDGKLSLDDPVRKYIPELPDYGKPLLIRHMLNHTSGLRDWGEVEAIAGWPRTSRVYTHAHVLDIVSRQRALNFEPGTNWSYSNTGYNLAAIIVTRVSGKPFPEFCRTRIFEPLGMTHTSWRDEFRRIVKGRAIGYDPDPKAGFLQDMPFEDVHGNGGLLTTVGDLLKWNENFVAPKVGDEKFVREQQQPGRFNDGRQHDYALGLYLRQYKGMSEIGHSGSTAGYRAYLARYPGQQVSVVVLCNAGGAAAADRYAHAVADLFLTDAIKRAGSSLEPVPEIPAVSDQMKAHAGMYRNRATGRPLTIVFDKNEFRLDAAASPGALLIPEADGRFSSPNGDREYEFDAKGHLAVTLSNGTVERYERVEPVRPTPTQLKPLAGSYWSDDAEVAMDVVLDGGTLVLTRRPDTRLTLKPLYKDAFSVAGLGMVRFRRNSQGRVTGMSVVLDRVWDMRFVRRENARPTT